MADPRYDFDEAGYDPGYLGAAATGDPDAEGRHANPVMFVHRRLRGRYRYAVPLAFVIALPMAAAGFFATKPTYESEGLIQVRPSLPKLLYSTEENEVPPLFDSFMKAQESFLRSRRVIDMAVETPRLQEAGWPAGPAGVAKLQRSLDVRRNSQVISVSVSSPDRRAAQEAVNAVLDAYQELYGEQGELSVSGKERQLVDREATIDRELQNLRERIFQIADEYGADTLDRLHESRVTDMERLDAELSNINFRIADLRQRAQAVENGQAPDPDLTRTEQAAASDPQLASLLREELRTESRLDSLSDRYGPNHRTIKQLRESLSEIRSAIERRTQDLIASGGTTTDATALAAANPAVALEQLESRKAQFQTLLERARREAITLGRKKLQISSLREQVDEKKQLLDDTRRRLESIRVESQASQTGRVTIAQRGDLPVSPDKDRRLPLAAAGAGFGAALSFGLFFLVGYVRDGYRFIDELQDVEGSAPLLGTLPDLSGGDLESDELAALSVHHLRNVLQLRDGRGRNLVYTITSATSGDGKTSLTLALGMSFAVSGRRTLLLDADLVGRGLTHELGLDGADGLCQAVDDAQSAGRVHGTRAAGLEAMPAGSAEEFEPEKLSHRNLSALLEGLREQYEVILIDTGPLLGSLESNLVAVLSDGVVLTVSRGRSPKLVEASLERLRRLGARCAGLVFNKATAHDLERSVNHFSFHSQSLRSQPRRERDEVGSGRSGLLVRAVRTGGRPELPHNTPHTPEASSKAS